MTLTPKPHALYSLRVASLPCGRQGCGLNPVPPDFGASTRVAQPGHIHSCK